MHLRLRTLTLLAVVGLVTAACESGADPDPTTTTAATAPIDITPPESGLYLLDEALYGTGRVVFPRDLRTPGRFEQQLPPGIPWGMAFTVPVGTELRSPFDGCLSVFQDRATGEQALTLVTLDDRFQAEIVGHVGLIEEPEEGAYCTLADGSVWHGAVYVARAAVIAVVEGEGPSVYGVPANLLIGFFDPAAGFTSDLETLVSFFSYAPNIGAAGVPSEDVQAILDLWNGLSASWSGGVDSFAAYLVDNNYPAYDYTIAQCASGFRDVGEGFSQSFDVFEWTIGRNDAWTMPDTGPGAGETPDGRIYAMAVEVTTLEPGRPPTILTISAHATVLGERAHFFIICR